MPTLLLVEGLRFYFFSDERQEPPHVHVRKGDSVAKLWLLPVDLAFARGFNRAEIRRIRRSPLSTRPSSSRGGMSTSAISAEPRARAIEFVADGLLVQLKDGRTLTVPLEWFPRLRDATDVDRQNFELYADGYAIHWPALDEDISVPGLLGLPD